MLCVYDRVEMTVAQLIKALRKYPQDMEVGYSDTVYNDDSFKVEPLSNARRLFVYERVKPQEDE